MAIYETPQANCAEPQDLVYKTVGERQLRIAILPPTTKKYDKAPVYFLITGGGWSVSNKQSMLDFSKSSSDVLRAEGWATASVEYRFAPNDGVRMAQIISDCMDGARYLRHFEKELGIDADRILTSGHSAGAHLALMLALAPHAAFADDSPFDTRLDDFTVIGSAPMSAPTVLYRNAAGYMPLPFNPVTLFDVETPEMVRERHRVSPIDYITPAIPATLVIAGTHDDLVYPDNSTDFVSRCRAVGADSELFLSHFGGHCFEPKVEGKTSYPDFYGVQAEIASFARKVLAKTL